MGFFTPRKIKATLSALLYRQGDQSSKLRNFLIFLKSIAVGVGAD
jgi:hypothetical protein